MIAVALLAALQQDSTGALLSPRARAMLDRFPPPPPGQVSLETRFSADTVWIGEQVELVTVAWLPRALRNRMRDTPMLKRPTLSGLWSLHGDVDAIPAGSRWVGDQYYDLFVADQTIFPLAAGRVDAPPAVLTYAVPVSTSFFAPQDRHAVASGTARLIARAIPANLVGALGAGPTARGMRATWRGPAAGLIPGSPAVVELIVSGIGNVMLWPAPEIAWPPGLHVYPEPTEEHVAPIAGLTAGEKHFRFTIVTDSAGVITLPGVRYPFFDPSSASVLVAAAAPFTLAVLPVAPEVRRAVVSVSGGMAIPVATQLVTTVWPLLIVFFIVPPLLVLRRRRSREIPRPGMAHPADPEVQLRALLGAPVEAGPDHVVAALRRRGIARDDAEHIRRWLDASGRRRYGASPSEGPEAPPAVARVLHRLGRGVPVMLVLLVCATLRAQENASAVDRYHGGDYAGAARAFAAGVQLEPRSAEGWHDLGAARWMSGDDVGAAAAWLRAAALNPRLVWSGDAWPPSDPIPNDVRSLAPTIPLSRDELVVLALGAWMAAWGAAAFGARRALIASALLSACFGGMALVRWHEEAGRHALVRAGALLRVSPEQTAPVLGDAAEWSLATIQRRGQGWSIVLLPDGRQGWLPDAALASIGPLD